VSCQGCGNDRRVSTVVKTADVDEETVCWFCTAAAIVKRVAEHRHQGDNDRPPGEPRYMDGRYFHVGPAMPTQLSALEVTTHGR
jgi:hypothetical protein